MKKMLVSLLSCALLSCVGLSSPARAVGDRTFHYDTALRMTFGLGYGKKAVRDEDFSKFASEVLTPTFKDGYCMLKDARGEWMHPERGLIRERNVVVLLDFEETPETRAARERVAQEFVRRFPGSNASVYMVVTPGIQASIYFQ